MFSFYKESGPRAAFLFTHSGRMTEDFAVRQKLSNFISVSQQIHAP